MALGMGPTDRARIVDDNVWQWIHDIGDASPVQPVANLGTGFIEYNPPEFVRAAHRQALDHVEGNQYAPVPGSHALKETIAEIYSPLHQRHLDPSTDICVTSGAQEGLLSCVLAFVTAGDEVILLEPVFTMYEYQIKMAGASIRYVPLWPPSGHQEPAVSGNEWTFGVEELERAISPQTKMIYINNPHNPLGKVFTRDELATIGNLCVKHDLVLLSDEVYEHLVFASAPYSSGHIPHTRVATLSPAIAARTLTAVSLGKLFNATGWRAGFVIGCPELMQSVIATHLVLAYSSSSPAQEACALGLRQAAATDWWTTNVKDIAWRIDRISQALAEVGLTFVAPASAYFILVNIDRVKLPSDYKYPPIVTSTNTTRDWKVCFFLVQEFGITSIPGSVFYGPNNRSLGSSYLRLGACKSDAGLDLAVQRISQLAPYIEL